MRIIVEGKNKMVEKLINNNGVLMKCGHYVEIQCDEYEADIE